MSTLSLTGFPSGNVEAVLRRASDDSLIASVAGTVFRGDEGRWQPSADFSGASIWATRTACYSGEGISFGVEGVNADALLFCDYEWDFGGDDYAFAHLTGSGLWATSAGTAQGPFVGHTFRTHGSFTVSVTVYDHTRAVIWSRSITVTVTDAAELPTIYYDPDAATTADAHTAAGVPDTTAADFRVGALEDVLGDLWGGSVKTRLLIKAGSTYTVDNTRQRWLANVHVDRYGTGDDPIIQHDYVNDVAPGAGEEEGKTLFYVYGQNVTIRNLHIKGSYNSITPPRYAPWLESSAGVMPRAGVNSDHFTMDACHVEGFQLNVNFSSVGPMPWVVSDCLFNHWHQFAVYAANIERASLIGCRMEQLEGTIEHPRKTGADDTPARATGLVDNEAHLIETAIANNWYATATGGCYRNGGWIKEFACHQVYAISRSGWSDAGGEWSNTVGPVDYRGKWRSAIQPCFRLLSGHTTIVSDGMKGLTSFSFWQVHGKGGSEVYTMAPTHNDPYTDSFILGRGYVWSQCIAEGGWDTRACWRTVHGNTAYRSCLGVIKDHVEWAGAEERYDANGHPVAALEVQTYGADGSPERNYDDVAAPVWALGCTFASEFPRHEFVAWAGNYRPVRERGCLALTGSMDQFTRLNGAPDRPTGMVTFGGVLASTVATVPGTGASVLGDGFEFAPRRDIAGNIRPAAAAAGAYEGQS